VGHSHKHLGPNRGADKKLFTPLNFLVKLYWIPYRNVNYKQ
jgi:hypothetical protein